MTNIIDTSHTLFDIVIPVGPNDINIASTQAVYTKKNVIGYRNIYLISYDASLKVDGCITISEDIFPFSLQTVIDHNISANRNGWYLQQLLKIYAAFVIPDILDKYLIIDADTFFLKPTTFFEDGKALYNYSDEYHIPYFIHMQKLHPCLMKMNPQISGICHHMMIERKYLKEIIDMVENEHKDIFYKIMLRNVVPDLGFSEYEIYFNYMLHKYPNDIKIRKLNWENTNRLCVDSNYDYISYHWYKR